METTLMKMENLSTAQWIKSVQNGAPIKSSMDQICGNGAPTNNPMDQICRKWSTYGSNLMKMEHLSTVRWIKSDKSGLPIKSAMDQIC
ncbi:hypothetical protein PoB_007421400 [Plakobranchus ocellatus]|uniref:Uncharacterized protein n=1 Tax=Plakobranchus ocellatus TaxID=259542 RepID=A0AAV4DU13_9GAST|nr:hypothetical protein PoB_007421400 [Plakobranchus ocellatus]